MTESAGDIVAFLRTRLDEDEATANQAAVDPVGAMEAHFEAHALHEEQDWSLYPERKTEYSRGQADAMHWASGVIRERMRPLSLHDPFRALRYVDAARGIVDMHAECGSGVGFCDDGGHRGDGSCGTLRYLAAVYREHPDYRAGWHPRPRVPPGASPAHSTPPRPS